MLRAPSTTLPERNKTGAVMAATSARASCASPAGCRSFQGPEVEPGQGTDDGRRRDPAGRLAPGVFQGDQGPEHRANDDRQQNGAGRELQPGRAGECRLYDGQNGGNRREPGDAIGHIDRREGGTCDDRMPRDIGQTNQEGRPDGPLVSTVDSVRCNARHCRVPSTLTFTQTISPIIGASLVMPKSLCLIERLASIPPIGLPVGPAGARRHEANGDGPGDAVERELALNLVALARAPGALALERDGGKLRGVEAIGAPSDAHPAWDWPCPRWRS